MAVESSPKSILDYEERRFPLNLRPELPDIRELWRQSNQLAWDPDRSIPWDTFDPSPYTPAQLDAARLYWSRRAWTEYSGTAESPAILLRLCLEPNREIDARLFWAVQTLEETRHCIASYNFAEKLGGYIAEPPIPQPRNTQHRGIRDRVLNPRISFEAFVVAHICIGETVAARLFEERFRQARDPIARELVRLILRDETRHIKFGWLYMAHRVKHFTPEQVAEIERVACDVVENSELKGYHCIWLSTDPATRPFAEANEIAAGAGLGACTAEQEAAVLRKCIADIRRDMAAWGVTIPVFQHEVLGTV
ncbi:MAG TPA: ferritin-like domain-containing protein [Chloroflexota bacterium]|nr:ferritin-like domain-containing protein [Chloroflexota bacterium]